MKTLSKYMLGATLALSFALASCSPEDVEGISENGLPLAENAKVTATVDQSTNQVTLNLEGDGQYPIWILSWESGSPYSTLNGLKKIVNAAGDYSFSYRVGNRNGISQGTGTATFHIDNSLVDYNKYKTLICDKQWRIASDEPGHLACGEPGSDGTGWWSAAPNEKAQFGLYDDVVSFTADGKYTYDPGEGGTVFVNKDCTVFPEGPQAEDFMVKTEKQESSYELTGEGTDVYIKMPAKTMFPYISSDDQYNSPKFRLESVTPSKMVLVADNGKTAWHYILTSGKAGFSGFNADSDCNLFKACKFTNRYYYAPGWSQIADPTMTADGNKFTVSLPTATTDQWQAQMFFETDMATNAANHYDFSAKITSNTNHRNVTLKLTKHGDDNTFYFVENIQLKAYQEYVFYKSDMPGIDMDNVDIVLDFGGNAADTEVTISDIDLQEHKCDGIEAPAEEEDKTVYDYDSDMNIWKKTVDDTNSFTTFTYYAPGWVETTAPEFTGDKGTYTLKLPTATNEQWQAQAHIITTIPAEADTKYDFCCTITPNKDIRQATVKLTDTASDENYLFLTRTDLKAYEETTVKVPASVLPKGAAGALKLVFDFGGNAADTEVTINKIVFQKTAL